MLEQVCRLARLIASPHEVAHCVLVAEGCPGRTTVMAKLAAHLCGFSIFKVNPNPLNIGQEYKLDSFKADLVLAYIRAGVKVSVIASSRRLFLMFLETYRLIGFTPSGCA